MSLIDIIENSPEENLGRDILMESGQIIISNDSDFEVVKFQDNLGQAVKNRLLVVIGELHGHSNYGSDLPLYLGSGKTEALLIEMKSAIYKTLLQEPRIDEIEDVNILFDEYDTTFINISINILPINSIKLLNLVYDLFI